MEYEVPLVLKEDVTILAVGDSLEAAAIRSVLEGLNFKVTIHWIGSRKELLEILKGNIKTDATVILSCHGVAGGIHIPDEPILGTVKIGEQARLENKVIINLGCMTGSQEFVNAFRQAGATAYVAPTDYPEARAALIFVSNLFFFLAAKQDFKESVNRASNFDKETAQFKLLA